MVDNNPRLLINHQTANRHVAAVGTSSSSSHETTTSPLLNNDLIIHSRSSSSPASIDGGQKDDDNNVDQTQSQNQKPGPARQLTSPATIPVNKKQNKKTTKYHESKIKSSPLISSSWTPSGFSSPSTTMDNNGDNQFEDQFLMVTTQPQHEEMETPIIKNTTGSAVQSATSSVLKKTKSLFVRSSSNSGRSKTTGRKKSTSCSNSDSPIVDRNDGIIENEPQLHLPSSMRSSTPTMTQSETTENYVLSRPHSSGVIYSTNLIGSRNCRSGSICAGTTSLVSTENVDTTLIGSYPPGHDYGKVQNRSGTIPKYIKKKVRGPYSQMLEMQMLQYPVFAGESTVVQQRENRSPAKSPRPNHSLSFTDELLLQTQQRRSALDNDAVETVGTAIAKAISAKQKRQNQQQKYDLENRRNSYQNYGPQTPSSTSSNIPNLMQQQSSVDSGNSANSGELESSSIESPSPPQPPVVSINQVDNQDQREPLPSKSVDANTKIENRKSTISITAAIERHLDTRAYIVGELYDTEKNYCETLKILYECYIRNYISLNPSSSTLPTILIDNHHQPSTSSSTTSIKSYMEQVVQLMPVALETHGKFLEQLRRRIADWNSENTEISSIFDIFHQPMLIDFYFCMVEHMTEISVALKPYGQADQKYGQSTPSLSSSSSSSTSSSTINMQNIQTLERQRRSMFNLENLLISIIQRVPRYELMLKRLLENTKNEHVDYDSLKDALQKIHELLLKIGTNQPRPASTIPTVSQSSAHSNDFSDSSSPLSIRHQKITVKDLEAVLDGVGSTLDQYRPDSPILFWDNVFIRKRERTVFVLAKHILICQQKNIGKQNKQQQQQSSINPQLTTNHKNEYCKYKIQQNYLIENVALRCQCWPTQSRSLSNINPQAAITANVGLATGAAGNGPSASNLLSPTGLSASSTDLYSSIQSISACRICTETLESDIHYILRLQKRITRSIHTVEVRRAIEQFLNEQLSLVVKQLAEMNETLSRCSKDCSVDMFIVPSDVETPVIINTQTQQQDQQSNIDSNLTNPASSAQPQQYSAEKKIRMTHNKCLAHGRTTLLLPSSSLSTNIVGQSSFAQTNNSSSILTGEPDLTITFNHFKKREDFETIVYGLRADIIRSRFRMDFLSPLPYQQARAGMEFTCALPAIGTNNIWICKSDGFIGQISVLTIDHFDRPTVISCNGVCNAKIICLKSVPPLRTSNKNEQHTKALMQPEPVFQWTTTDSKTLPNKSKRQGGIWSAMTLKRNSSSSIFQNEQTPPKLTLECQQQLIQTADDSYGDTTDDDSWNDNSDCPTTMSNLSANQPLLNRPNTLIGLTGKYQPPQNKLVPPNTLPITPSQQKLTQIADEQRNQINIHKCASYNEFPSTMADTTNNAVNAPIRVEEIANNPNVLNISPDCPTMWFGTEDSTIYVYSCLDAVRIRKNKAKVLLHSKIEAIEYYKERVFVSLANHTVAIFSRDECGQWQINPEIKSNIHCYRFCVVNHCAKHGSCLWTTSANVIQICDEHLNVLEEPIIIKEVEEISFIIENQDIFIGSRHSSYVYRYSSKTPYQLLASISIGPSVNKALALCAEIIRFHKNACLKICAMHLVRDRILIGTSAGVILILDLNNTLEIVPNGHTGYVKFITSTVSKDGRLIIVSGGDGVMKFSPGTTTTQNSLAELFHFMSYCSNLALNLLGRPSSSNSSPSGTGGTTGANPSNSLAMVNTNNLQTPSLMGQNMPSAGQSLAIGSTMAMPAPSTFSPSDSGEQSIQNNTNSNDTQIDGLVTTPTSAEISTPMTAPPSLSPQQPNQQKMAIQQQTQTMGSMQQLTPMESDSDDSKSYLLIWKVN